MRWLLDRNVMIEAAAGVPSAARAMQTATTCEWCGFSAISRLEIFGFPGLTTTDEQTFEALLRQFVEVGVDNPVLAEAIRLRRLVRMKTPDAIIGATALLNQASLVTRNIADFKHTPGLTVVDTATL
jgi:predicted nucleic acid-binding protein